jgi:hypothetical protein
LEADKRKLIVNEIHHWRKSKLLPEHYCDFLLNLYADDSGKTEAGSKSMLSSGFSLSIQNSHWKFWLMGTVVAVLFSLFVFNFTLFPMQMQIGLSSIFILFLYAMGYRWRSTNPIGSYSVIGLGSVLLLFAGLRFMEANQLEQASDMAVFLLLCSSAWIIIGAVSQKHVFQFCGWIGCLLLYAWLLLERLDVIAWSSSQLSWLPITVVFGWIGWLCQHRSKKVAFVYFGVAIVVWFVPEVFLGYANGYSDIVQYSLTGKLVLLGVASFATRKKWSEWVA